MIGKTNIPMGVSKGETVSILLKTNQSSNEDLNGVKVVVSYDDESHEYTYNGQFSVEIPKDKTYTVTFDEVDGYKTPSSVTYTATQGFSRSIEVTYYGEKVTVDVSAEGGASVDGQSVIVETGVPSEGVYIEDTSYKLWTAEEWDNSATANSIVVSDGSMARRIALTIISYRQMGEVNFPDEMEAISDSNLAIQDFNGKSNTNILKENNNKPTADYVTLYYIPFIFPDGVTKGYIPALGELYFLYQKKTEISEALSACGGDEWDGTGNGMPSHIGYDFYSSTRANINRLWLLNWNTGELYSRAPYGNVDPGNTRAISEYNMSHPITNSKASFSVTYDETYTVSLSDMDGYTTPASQTYTASQPTREISMEYKKAVEHVIVNVSSDDNTDMDGYKVYVRPNVANGVYIQGVDGKLYTESEWNTMKVANGIAVVTDECSFVIALEDARKNVAFSTTGGNISLTITSYTEEAVLDFNGLGNTNNIISTSYDTNNAAHYCRDYIFPNGQTGYLGAAGEWNAVLSSVYYIEEVLSVAGGETFGGYTWTSTGYDENGRFYVFDPMYNQIVDKGFYDANYARAFAELGSSYTITNGKVEFDVAPGVEYRISVEDVDGYTTPEPQSFVAESGTRTVNMVYKEVKLGVFIQGVSGKLYNPDYWTSQETPNGVAVLTENCKFVMALNNAHTRRCEWGYYGSTVNGITTTTNGSTAKTDYDGETQTTVILEDLGNDPNYAAAAYYCRAYTFPNGKKGYLGAAGEWQEAMNNKNYITDALEQCDGAKIGQDFWTSTQYDSFSSWVMRSGFNVLYDFAKYNTHYVRAFCSL